VHHRNNTATLQSIITHTSALNEIRCIEDRSSMPITWKNFSDMGDSVGSSLQIFNMSLYKASGVVSPAVFARFSQMREFSWDSRMVFKTAPKSISADTFRLLVELKVDLFDESFLTVLSHMECVPGFCIVHLTDHLSGCPHCKRLSSPLLPRAAPVFFRSTAQSCES
jgi:hypothetical protein